uniref:Bromo domain-containing protein n=1 Tax=Polytomella parva TaxID=51329 RepID=A0A7S0V3A0_9CHLO|mmetsp:Transcript_29377/g.53905  ORF Transcript_29377/g.53905 Transcript_29377/m.53905 type:complete len:406 (+) Transcript_29377:303-1520(+)
MGTADIQALSKRIRLRLDDGSLIAFASSLGVESGTPAVHLSASDAVRLNLASDEDYKRIQRILATPELPELPAIEETTKVEYQNLAKSPPAPVRPSPAPQRPPLPHNWQAKCREIITKLKRTMGREYEWFEQKVDPRLVPDYYHIIQKPMWFHRILELLESRQYKSPVGFVQDVRQLWTNCKMYNKVDSLVRVAGDRGERRFEELWTASGLAAAVTAMEAADATVEAPAAAMAAANEPKLSMVDSQDVDRSSDLNEEEIMLAAMGAHEDGFLADDLGGLGSGSQNGSTHGSGGSRAADARSESNATSAAGSNHGVTRTDTVMATEDGEVAEDQTAPWQIEAMAMLEQAITDNLVDAEGTEKLIELIPNDARLIDDDGLTEIDFVKLDKATVEKIKEFISNLRAAS